MVPSPWNHSDLCFNRWSGQWEGRLLLRTVGLVLCWALNQSCKALNGSVLCTAKGCSVRGWFDLGGNLIYVYCDPRSLYCSTLYVLYTPPVGLWRGLAFWKLPRALFKGQVRGTSIESVGWRTEGDGTKLLLRRTLRRLRGLGGCRAGGAGALGHVRWCVLNGSGRRWCGLIGWEWWFLWGIF